LISLAFYYISCCFFSSAFLSASTFSYANLNSFIAFSSALLATAAALALSRVA
jgi:hypothetical protein